MPSLADKLRAAAAAETAANEKLTRSKTEKGENHNDDQRAVPAMTTQRQEDEIADKLKSSASITTPRQNNLDPSTDGAILPRVSLVAEKLRSAAAAAEKLKQQQIQSSSNPIARPRAATKMLAAVAVAKIVGATIPWGSYDYLEKIDITTLSNEKLRKHLSARGVNTQDLSGKRELIDRLAESLEEERQRELAITLELEAKHRQIADLEEQGAVYVCGKNCLGQLGLGDIDDRQNFTVIPLTRGKKVQHISTSADFSLATTESHEVFCWGGGGMGPMGVKGKCRSSFQSPQLIVKLNGEDIVMTSVGANHAIAVSEGGDVFSWGKGDFGVLGAGDQKKANTPKFLDCIDRAVAVSCGEQHTCLKTSNGEIYGWGHASNGRLGIGRLENDKIFQTSPFQVQLPASQIVRHVACGAEHTLAATNSNVFSFGSGDGGRLGHGPDHSDRWEPTEIVALRGSHILDISAGTWHSAVIVNIPPMRESGYLYTFGSGFQGQLGLDKTCQTSIPTLVTAFCNGQVNVKRIFCGSTHNAAITIDGNLWTWGSNKHGALGRSIEEETSLTFSPHPGIVPEFGAIVNRIGRGLPRSVGKIA